MSRKTSTVVGALCAGALTLAMAIPASAAMTHAEGYITCPDGMYVYTHVWVDGGHNVTMEINGSRVGTDYTSNFTAFSSLTNNGNWDVYGKKTDSVSDGCYAPGSGPLGGYLRWSTLIPRRSGAR